MSNGVVVLTLSVDLLFIAIFNIRPVKYASNASIHISNGSKPHSLIQICVMSDYMYLNCFN